MHTKRTLWLLPLLALAGCETGNTFFAWTDPNTGQETKYLHAESVLPGTVAALMFKQVDDQEPVLLAQSFETGPLNALISGASDIIAAEVIDFEGDSVAVKGGGAKAGAIAINKRPGHGHGGGHGPGD